MKNKHNNVSLQITGNRWFPLVFLPIAFIFVLINSYSTSPLFVHEGMDSCVFKTMGLALLQGKTPYVDFFDHKGPILYFINAFGQFLVPGRMGLFFLQVVWMSLTLFFLYQTASLFIRSDVAFLAILLSSLILTGLYLEGNQCEEWELLAISIGTYTAARYILFPGKTLLTYSFIWGLCFGYIFFIRPNDAVSQIGGIMIGIYSFMLIKKDWWGIIKSASMFIVGWGAIFIPVLLFFFSRHALPDLLYGMLIHNTLYAGGIVPMILSCFGHQKLCFFLLFVTVGCMTLNTRYKEILFLLVPVFLLSLILTGVNLYQHYFIVFTPLFLLFWVFLFQQKNVSMVLLSLSMLYCSSYGSPANFINGAKNATVAKLNAIHNGDRFYNQFYSETDKLVEMIPPEDRDDVWNYNLMWGITPDFSILFHNGIVQCNKVPFFPMYMVDKKLKDLDNIEKKQPKWIFISHSRDSENSFYYFSQDYDYIRKNYTLAGSCNSLNYDIELFHINDVDIKVQ